MKTAIDPWTKWRRANPLMVWARRTKKRYGWMGPTAAAVGVSRQAMYCWLTGESSPQAVHMDALYKMSKGIVNYDDWRRWLRSKPPSDAK